MKKSLRNIFSFALSAISIFSCSCSISQENSQVQSSHEHVFNQEVVTEEFLSAEATCKIPNTYFYSCTCGEKSDSTFTVGKALPHSYADVVDKKYEIREATCTQEGRYYKSCANCGQQSFTETFNTEKSNEHNFTQEIRDDKYLKTAATPDTNAVYYKSCICGAVGEDTFLGDKVGIFSEEEKVAYQPTSLTVTLYDSELSEYGFTYNTESKPLYPVIQMRLANSGAEWSEYLATVEEMTSYTKDDLSFTYYVSKAVVDLEANTLYEYRAYDKYVETGTEIVTFEAKDTTADAFTFVHVSDTQEYPADFGTVLQQTVGKADFLLHTGDVVETSKYEEEWTDMLHSNFQYLSKIPMMAISGNHETTYKCGSNETYKHFHNKIPEQKSTKLGYFYSFVYGDVKFIMLNTNNLVSNKLEDAQYEWLVEELESNTCKWTIVAMHNPMYGVGQWGAGAGNNTISLALRYQLQGIFAQYGVDMVLQGHDHTVSRTYPINGEGKPQTETLQTENGVSYSVNPNGVIYIANGTAGGQVKKPCYLNSTNEHLYSYAAQPQKSMRAEISVDNDKLTVTVKYGNGSVYRTWGIKKS